jgi:DNA-binding transcriptional ArsR family regulator
MSKPREDGFLRAAKLLKAISHRLRLAIVCGLRDTPCTQTYIADTLGIPQSTVAQHLKVLRNEGVIAEERRGVEVVFSLSDPRLAPILDTLCGQEAAAGKTLFSWKEIASIERTRRRTPAADATKTTG